MIEYEKLSLLDRLEMARICAGAEFEKLCNENNHIEATIFQSIRDSLAVNIQVLKDYMIITSENCSDKKEENDE